MKGYLRSCKNVLQAISSKLGAINYSSILPRTATWEPYLADAHNSICTINYSKENHPVPLLIAMQKILMYCLQHDLHLGRIHLTDEDIYCKLSHPSTCHWVCKVHIFGIIEHSPSVYLMKETLSCRMSILGSMQMLPAASWALGCSRIWSDTIFGLCIESFSLGAWPRLWVGGLFYFSDVFALRW